MKFKPLRPFAVALAWLTFGGVASADVTVDEETSDGQFYEFKDDLMDGAGTAPTGWVLRGVHKPKRSLLLRVRASFVPQMLRSVEHL